MDKEGPNSPVLPASKGGEGLVRLLTPDEAASLLQVSVGFIYEMTSRRGRHRRHPMPCLRVGRYLRFDRDALIEWAKNNV